MGVQAYSSHGRSSSEVPPTFLKKFGKMCKSKSVRTLLITNCTSKFGARVGSLLDGVVCKICDSFSIEAIFQIGNGYLLFWGSGDGFYNSYLLTRLMSELIDCQLFDMRVQQLTDVIMILPSFHPSTNDPSSNSETSL
ncbi:hypothetical protein AVEN_160464-1 [Araneus ventricosus]|uniref:Uncharacterized protein n=1 Tax=Araneus ventricosus TaxID=182803 RepID=A0A4Y2U9I9_ARAVE|nr:hypothetical protein AVEN_160464-1 [Araneus ventricosus]